MRQEQILYELPQKVARKLDYELEYDGHKIDILHRFGYKAYAKPPFLRTVAFDILETMMQKLVDKHIGFHPHAEKWIVTKWKDPDMKVYELQRKDYGLFEIIRKLGIAPYEVNVGHAFKWMKINGMLNEGLDEIWDHVDGTDVTNNYTNALARVGVGNGTTVFSATHTGLQGASTAFAAMDATFPTSTAQKINLKGSFPTGQAEFAWEEGTADNGATPNNNLHRLVQSKGTKPVGETWTSESQITGS